jgi:hypothetical protein
VLVSIAVILMEQSYRHPPAECLYIYKDNWYYSGNEAVYTT